MSRIKIIYPQQNKGQDGITYNMYLDGKRYKKNMRIGKQKQIITLEEDNLFFGHFWWLTMFFLGVLSVLGGTGDDWKDVRRIRKRIQFEFEGCEGSMVIHIESNGNIYKVEGVREYNIISNEETDISATVNKRIKTYKTILLAFCFGFLAVVSGLVIFRIFAGK